MNGHPFRDDPQYEQQYSRGLGFSGNGLGSIGARHSAVEIEARESEDSRTVGDILDQAGLTEKQRFVIELRHGMRGGIPMTHREIAEIMGVTHRAVQDLEKAAKKKLAKLLAIGA